MIDAQSKNLLYENTEEKTSLRYVLKFQKGYSRRKIQTEMKVSVFTLYMVKIGSFTQLYSVLTNTE